MAKEFKILFVGMSPETFEIGRQMREADAAGPLMRQTDDGRPITFARCASVGGIVDRVLGDVDGQIEIVCFHNEGDFLQPVGEYAERLAEGLAGCNRQLTVALTEATEKTASVFLNRGVGVSYGTIAETIEDICKESSTRRSS